MLHILLIEDDEVDRTMVRRALKASGAEAEFEEVSSGTEGIAALRARRFDCALLDYRLPDGDGLAILREIRGLGITTPIVMLTGQGDEQLAVDMMKAGASDYLSKTRLSRDLLSHAVRHAIGLHEAQTQCEQAQEQIAQSQERFRFLAEASALLGGTLDYATGLTKVAELAVPSIADRCSIQILGVDGKLQRLAPAAGGAAADGHREPPELHDAIARVVQTGSSELLSGDAAMVVPLRGHDGVLGAFTFENTGANRRFGHQDVALAEDLARRAATAVEHSRLYAQLNEAKDAAVAANAAKDQFLAVLSHEMRTPLTPVLSTVQALESDPDLPPSLRDSIQMIRRNVELEARLIDDLLDLTRIARGKLELNIQSTDVHDCIRSVVDICIDELRGKRQELVIKLEAECAFVRADYARLQQVFWNLLKNAVKFTPDGGRIVIATGNPQPGRLRAEVRDNGIGIDQDVLPFIFGAFEQGERSVTRRFGGLGLGLAISKALVDMQGGTLRAESMGPNQGAAFIADFPVTAASALRPHVPADNGKSAAAGLRILLVDDHEDTAKAMRRLLNRLGYDVALAGTVSQALDEFGRDRFDLLISDIGLPDGSGLELMRQIRQRSDIPGIALSGFGMQEDIRKSTEAGFAEHLTKPVNFRNLDRVIRNVIAEPARS